MKTIYHLILILITSILIKEDCVAQFFSKTFPEDKNKFFKTLVEVDHDFVTFTFGNSPRLLFLNRSGDVTKEINLPQNIMALYCLEYSDEKIYLGGKNEQEQALLITLDKKGNLLFTKSYPLSDITSILKINESLYFGGRQRQFSAFYAKWLKVNQYGNIIWQDSLQIHSQSRVTKIISKNEEPYVIIGSMTVGVGFSGFTYLKLDSLHGHHEKILEFATGRGHNLIEFDISSFPLDAENTGESVFITSATQSSSIGSGSILYTVNEDDKAGNKIKLNTHNKMYYPLGIKFHQDQLFLFGYSVIDKKTRGFIQARKQNGELIWNKHFDALIPHDLLFQNQYLYTVGSNGPYFKNDEYNPVFSRLSPLAEKNSSGLYFSAQEVVGCNINPTHSLREPLKIKVNGLDYIIPDNEGLYVDLPLGKADISIVLPQNYSICNPIDTILVTETVKDHIFKLKRDTCQEVICGITATDLVRNLWNKLYVSCLNKGGNSKDSVKVIVKSTLPLHSLQSSFSFTKLSENEVLFNVGLLSADQKVIIDLSLFVDKNTDLFSSHLFKARIVNLSDCPTKYSAYEGPSLHGELLCLQNNEVRLKIQNAGANMLVEKNYTVFMDGYPISSYGFLLDKNEVHFRNFSADGRKIDIVMEEDETNPYRKYNVVSLEGCGRYDNNYFSKSVSVQFGEEDASFYSSFIPLEIREFKTGNRIFETNQGAGYYHLVPEQKNNYEFVLRYINESPNISTDLVIYLDLSSKFDLSSIDIVAFSHLLTYDLIDDWVVIRVYNTEILPGEEFHMRFYARTLPERQDITYVDVSAYGIVNSQQYVYFQFGYHNVTKELNVKEQSPHPYTPKGQIFGKHNAFDFYNDLCVLEDDSKILVTTLSEGSMKDLTVVYFIDKNEKLVWEKTFQFDGGNAYFYKVVPLDENNILLLGTMTDHAQAITYAGYGYFIALSINRKGEKNWQKIWRTNNNPSLGGGSILFAYKQHDKVIFGGTRRTFSGRKNYYSSIDIHGNISDYYDFDYKFDFFHNQTNDKILLLSLDDKYPKIQFDYIIINHFDEPPIRGKFSYPISTTFELVDIAIENDQIVLLGYTYDATNFNHQTKLLKCNIITNETRKIDVDFGFDSSMYVSPSKLLINDSGYYLSGQLIIKEPYSVDAIIVKTDSMGKPIWHFSEDFNSREYVSQVYLSKNTFYIGFQTQAKDILYNLQCGYFKIVDDEISTLQPLSDSIIISVYPNPSSTHLSINTNKNKLSYYKIFDSSGRVISFNLFTQTIDISNLQNGNYLLVLYDDSHNIFPKQFIKM